MLANLTMPLNLKSSGLESCPYLYTNPLHINDLHPFSYDSTKY